MDESIDYCRQVEAYLCKKNGGHLVRIVGPAFEQVRDWAAQGVPLKVAFKGIDRCCERAGARGGRRRPMRIEFCQADVLDAFDDWRRAIGVATTRAADSAHSAGSEADDASGSARKGSLAAHIQRSVTRLLAPKGLGVNPEYDSTIGRITDALDDLAVRAKSARGDTRSGIALALQELDRRLLEAARERIDAPAAAALRAEADAELAGLAPRMSAEALAGARERAFERLLRDSFNLPVLTYE